MGRTSLPRDRKSWCESPLRRPSQAAANQSGYTFVYLLPYLTIVLRRVQRIGHQARRTAYKSSSGRLVLSRTHSTQTRYARWHLWQTHTGAEHDKSPVCTSSASSTRTNPQSLAFMHSALGSGAQFSINSQISLLLRVHAVLMLHNIQVLLNLLPPLPTHPFFTSTSSAITRSFCVWLCIWAVRVWLQQQT